MKELGIDQERSTARTETPAPSPLSFGGSLHRLRDYLVRAWRNRLTRAGRFGGDYESFPAPTSIGRNRPNRDEGLWDELDAAAPGQIPREWGLAVELASLDLELATGLERDVFRTLLLRVLERTTA